MRIWLVKDLEPIPGDAGDRRLLRAAMLSEALAQRGHDVSWITSTFDHYAKQHRVAGSETRILSDNYRVEILRAPGYRSNISPLRIWHNRCFARSFLDFAASSRERPDVIVTDIPTTETAEAAIRVARRWNIPSLLSIRDLWPDFFKNFVSRPLRPFLTVPVMHFERQVSYACRNATAIVGISPKYLEWGLSKGKRNRGELDAIIPLGYQPLPMSRHEAERTRRQLQSKGVNFEKRLVTFVGSWGKTCDLDVVLAAARSLISRNDLQFVLAGNGDQRAALMSSIADSPNVIAPGWLNARQVTTLLKASELGLLPYRETAPQGLPNKIFEYMAHGTFQISTLEGEAASLLRSLEAGETTTPGDGQAMSAAIIRALDNKNIPEERGRIQERFLMQYSSDVVYDALIDRIEVLHKHPCIPNP